MDVAPGNEQHLEEIARDYYLAGLSKVELAKKYAVSRFHIARLLNYARESGLVRIEIGTRQPVDPDLGPKLASALGLAHVALSGTAPNSADNLDEMATTVARHLETICTSGQTLGISWSRTLSAAAMRVRNLPHVELVQLAGALPAEPGQTPFAMMHHLHRLSGAPMLPLWAPLIVDSARTAQGLRRQKEIGATLEAANSLDAAVVAIGAWQAGYSTVWDYVSEHERIEGQRLGAIAECSGRLFNAEGKLVPTELDARVMAVNLAQLAATPTVLGIARGANAAQGLQAAARTGMMTTAVIDVPLALRLAELLGV